VSSVLQKEVLRQDSVLTPFSAPFPPGYRASGVLMHVTSLPSPYGIGDLGPSAFEWIDRLVAARQSWWQVLPLGPTGYGHSPYQALSSFAANPLIVSPDLLLEDGLLSPDDLGVCDFAPEHVDFQRVIPFKHRILARAWENFQTGTQRDLRLAFEQFCEDKGPVQESTALFMAVRTRHGESPCQQWPAGLIRPDRNVLEEIKRELGQAIDQFRFGQFLVLRQWHALKRYANDRGVRILGDLPIFVSPDSADVWADPELFLVDEQLNPRFMAGVPPDYFSADGQLWGNPLYNWEAHQRTGYRWWINRVMARLDYVDAIRIDHFRGFQAAWHVPAGATTAASGRWVAGPGADFFEKLRAGLGSLPFLAEDLGVITPAIEALRDQFQLPGMRVLQFAFSGDPNNPHLPHRCVDNSVIYTGTHDNDTTRGWYDTLPDHARREFWNYAKRQPAEPEAAPREMLRLAWSSPAALAITPFQDLLGLGSEARMNLPGCAEGQWSWRCSCDNTEMQKAFQRLHELTASTQRLSGNSSSSPLPRYGQKLK
jgi:4-alpha-glucanotransferase